MLTSYNNRPRFRFASFYSRDQDKWQQLDQYLEELVTAYPDEFSKPVYADHNFMNPGTSTIFSYHPDVPAEIQQLINRKMKEIFQR